MKFTQLIKLYEVTQKFGPPYTKIYNNGEYKMYYKDPNLRIVHRVDGPAIEYADGSEAWYLNNQLHRVGGPAITLSLTSNKPFYTMEIALHAGDKAWYQNNYLHRTDGPAVERHNGQKLWYINGNRLTLKEIEEIKKKNAIKTEIQSHKNNRIDPGMLEDYL